MITEKTQKLIEHFNHKVRPFEHQDKSFNQTRELEFFAYLWEMGCGKTKPVLDTAAWLFLKGEIDGLLVICDNGAYRNWIDYEVPIHMMEEIEWRIAAWTSSMRRQEEYEANQLLRAEDDVLDILVMNVEAFSGKRAPVFAEAFLRAHYSMMVVDESTSIKNPRSKRTETLLALKDHAAYRRIMTGTPITNSPIDLWSQFEFLKPGILGFESFVAFRSMYCRTILVDLGRGKKYAQIVGYQNLEMLTKSLTPHSSRLLKADCLTLPEKLYEEYSVEHTPEQAQAYADMREKAIIELESGQITAMSALVNLEKLHQINCGHVKNDDGVTVDLPNNRVLELIKILEVIGRKTIIWAHFIRDIELICQALPQGSWVNYYGATSKELRPEAITRFRTDPTCQFFVSNQATGGKGITLVESAHVIYYSQSYNLMHRLQSEDRCHRPGQRSAVTYIDMVVPGTVDVKIVKALKSKKDLAAQILDCYRGLLEL